ncbi:MAG: nicotinamide-nucleotide adenylyltransferase [Candidatus Aenigmarchaeota archaeon]|nr:nicotinamide-nucleotide adenylyltransferase [Candidatus Aenigmarchaeota archaeon]
MNLYIGRFQPFHLGHLEAVKYLLEKEEKLIIGIGSAQYSFSLENPFSAGERLEMITDTLREEKLLDRVYLSQIPDTEGKYDLWVPLVERYCPKFDKVYSNNDFVKFLFEARGYKTLSIPKFEPEKYSSSLIRQKIINQEAWEDLVPNAVSKFIKVNKLDERLVRLAAKGING